MDLYFSSLPTVNRESAEGWPSLEYNGPGPQNHNQITLGDLVMIDRDRLVNSFCDLVRIDSPSDEEEDMARHLTQRREELSFQVDRAAHLKHRSLSSGGI